MAVTALAGPAANFVTAFIAYCLYFVVWIYGNSCLLYTSSGSGSYVFGSCTYFVGGYGLELV